MKKRILSMFLMLTMVISLIVVPGVSVSAVSYYDTVDTDCELAVDVLNALGIMGGYTDGSFLPYNTITRAEMVSVAVKLAGLDGYSDQAPDDMELFNDMYDYDGWASGVIAIAKAAGIARSDEEGNFNPDMSATYEDALQMVVSALGYGHQAVSRGGELGDYVYVAQRLGLTKKLSTGIGQNITRGDVAKLVYAALTVDLMEAVTYSTDGTATTYEAIDGKNALNTYFDVYEINGIITENEHAAIDGDTTVEEMQILINDEAFNVGYTDIASYLGYYATVYALEDDDEINRTVIAYSIKSVKNNTVTIPAENIVDVSYSIEGYTFEYWGNIDTDRKTKDITTSATPRVLYNGKAVFDVTEALLSPEYGEVVLIDNNGDDDYDIIDVWEYELVYVFSASQVSGNVVGYYDRSTTYKFDPEDEDYHVTFLNAYGGAAQLSDIKQYSVLYVYESLDGLEKKVVISNNKITGAVTEASSDGYVINGTEYELSPYVVGKVELAVSDSGDYYLDADNRIAGFEGTTVIRRNIGMFIAANDGGLKRGYQMKVLTANSGVQIYDLASTVMVNGSKMSSAEIYGLAYSDALFGKKIDDNNANGAGLTRPHPSRSAFLYKLNSDNEISEMTVVGEGDGDGFLQVRKVNEKKPNYYSRGYNCLHHSDEKYYNEDGIEVGKRTYCDGSTINFISDEALANTNDNQSYYTKYMTTYSDNYYFDNFDYMYAYYYSPDGEPIDMQKTVCNFLVTEDWYDGSVDSTEDAEQSRDASLYQDNTAIKFIYKITQANDKSTGDPTVRVYYFDGTNIRNALVRPAYIDTAYYSRVVDGEEVRSYYPNGFPVRIAFDGAYIEEIAPFFGGLYDGADMWTMVQPIYNASTGTNIMPFMPFYQSQWKAWASWSSGTTFESRYDCGIVTAIDEVVGRKLFSVAHITGINSAGGNGKPAEYSTGLLLNERLEGTVYRVNFDRDGYLESFTKGSLDDVTPGQLVLVRRRMYDSGSSKWTSLNRYGIYEIYIISEDASELDYLKDFYNQVQEEYVEE